VDEMVDYLSDVAPMRRPVSAVWALSGPVPDRGHLLAASGAGLQRRMATNSTIAVEDAAAAGASDI